MKTGVLLMAYGAPERLDEVDPFLRKIFAPRAPSPSLVAEFQERYRRIGGRSPLPEITRAQARALQARLGAPVYVGMRHGTPSIPQAVDQARREGVNRFVGLALAPHYSPVSAGAYRDEFLRTGADGVFVECWHLEPTLLEYWRMRIRGKDFVLFTAHSVPERDAGPYPGQLAEMISAIAGGPHRLAYQSRGGGSEPWLGPSLSEILPSLPQAVAVAAIGFVSDNAEILYDLDLLHRREAEAHGIRWERLPMPNDHPLLIEALASAVGKNL